MQKETEFKRETLQKSFFYSVSALTEVFKLCNILICNSLFLLGHYWQLFFHSAKYMGLSNIASASHCHLE